jgi:hypothetical protein
MNQKHERILNTLIGGNRQHAAELFDTLSDTSKYDFVRDALDSEDSENIKRTLDAVGAWLYRLDMFAQKPSN